MIKKGTAADNQTTSGCVVVFSVLNLIIKDIWIDTKAKV